MRRHLNRWRARSLRIPTAKPGNAVLRFKVELVTLNGKGESEQKMEEAIRQKNKTDRNEL